MNVKPVYVLRQREKSKKHKACSTNFLILILTYI